MLSVLLYWGLATIFWSIFVVWESGNAGLKWRFFYIDFLQVFDKVLLLLDFLWQIVMRYIVLSKWYFLTSALTKTVSICSRSKIRADIINLPKTQIFRTLNSKLIPFIFSWTYFIYCLLNLENSLWVRSKFFDLISLEFLLNFHILFVMTWARIFFNFVYF